MPTKATVLIVDNKPAEIESLGEQLQADANVLYANSGRQALEMANELGQLDLVLVEIDLPEMNGFDVCMNLKSAFSRANMPIVMIGQANEDDRQKSLDLGAVDFIGKPYSLVSAQARINKQLELKQKTDLLAELASLDGLTVLPNREAFIERVDVEWRRSVREFYPLTLLMIGIDQFSAVNDQYGYGVGDECLKRVARAIESCCLRAADMVARTGGDEFSALLPSIDLDNALVVAERMCDAVIQMNIPHQSSNVGKLTVSIGVGTIEPTQDGDYQLLIDETEEMLYRARQLGGNQAQGISI